MKSGTVLIVGRPNSGKSTLINALVGKKVSITSNKPQTTQQVLQALYWDKRGQIIFLDTPGVYTNPKNPAARKIPGLSKQEAESADVVVYLVDKTRHRGEEENRVLGFVRNIDKPKIFALNKVDVDEPDYTFQYKILEDEFDDWIEISALKHTHLKTLLEKIFEYLPEGEPIFDPKNYEIFPVINYTAEDFVAEIIREKAYQVLYQEVPYTLEVIVEKIEEKEDLFEVKAHLITTAPRYKGIIIGQGGKTIKEIGTMARKELETITNKQVYLNLNVRVK